MTDSDIINALECIASVEEYGDCYEVLRLAIDLINHQKAEIACLKNKQQATEQVTEQVTDQVRSKAIKEFAYRLRQRSYKSSDWSRGEHPMVVEWDDIDDVLEEMVGERE